ncbi:magnesium/cobalt transporter CorA [Persicimonas caeni]|uniref:Magnesium transport protein CorA n=1 Tax=Persicimonas caeni TaxID=2292766 RepID=A0A4Y6PLV4_PERCE|nr:magnesium/cobalt transporter CorA [Persicimonas caeni]QDG49271.1 magnesium/cobalt transporter CorA [Persicimonas caeni]QED30492.1 magnesium/cobalt transporter CorA [Persicimonas caeni]
MAEKPSEILAQLLSHMRVPRLMRSRPGAPPGLLADLPEAPPPDVRLLAYNADDHVEQKLETLDELPQYLEKWDVVWLDVEGTGDSRLLEHVGEVFQIPKLALEDVQNPAHRPKLEFFDERMHLILRMAHWREERIELEPVNLFVGPNFVVTFQLADRPTDYFEPIRSRILSGRRQIRTSGADYLAYAIIDRVIDAGLPVLEAVAETYHELEAEVLEPSSRQLITRIHAMNSQLLVLRRAVAPHREILQTLRRHPETVFSEEVIPFLGDCYDHAAHVAELSESYHALGVQILDFHLSISSHRQNEITKVLTIIATIFIPLTFIAGIYGMNFNPQASKWNMPELEWAYGYPFVLVLMFAIGVALVAFFWRKGWIGWGD